MSVSHMYSAYKMCEIPWIDEIPTHWNIVRGKNILQLLERPVLDDDEIITCFRDGEVTLRKNRREEGFTVSLKEIGYQGVEPGDLVVHGMDGFAGAIGVSDSRGKASPVLIVMDSNENKRFLMYYLRALAYRDVFMSLSTGIRVRSCDLRWNKLSNLPFCLPPIIEQNRIATYLDSRITKIDKLIKETETSIEEYQLLKAATVCQAVTKGMGDDVTTKDSGVEFIGRIPANWNMVPMKRIFDFSNGSAIKVGPFGSALSGADIVEEGVWVYNQRTVLDQNFETNTTFVTEEKANALSGFEVLPGDILITTRGSIGKIAIVPEGAPKGVLHPCVIRFRTDKRYINDELLKMLFNESDFMLEQMLQKSNSTTIDVLYSYNLKELLVPVIPEEERKRITEFLVRRCKELNTIILTKQELISDLKSYKRSFVYETVTGKRKVV